MNKPDVPVEHAPSVPAGSPVLEGEHSDLARRFWQSLGRSGQSQFYEESDWLAAELVVAGIDAFVNKPSAVMYQTIQAGMSLLLVTEGDRRRMRLELEKRPEPGTERDAAISDLGSFRKSHKPA